MAEYRTPGVYIEEKNAFPGSAVAVETAVPAFIGYTQKAERQEKSLTGIPTKVRSFAEFTELFGAGYKHVFTLKSNDDPEAKTFKLNNKGYDVAAKTSFMLFNSIRLFYQNGGADCFILSVGGYSDIGVEADKLNNDDVWEALEREFEPTLIVIPDAVLVTNTDTFYDIYTAALRHCERVQSRFAIFDVPIKAGTDDENISNFRAGIGINFLNYGAAYYPWLHTSIVAANEVNFLNLGGTSPQSGNAADSVAPYLNVLDMVLPEAEAKSIITAQRKIINQKIAFSYAVHKGVSTGDVTGKEIFELLYPETERLGYVNKVHTAISYLKKSTREQENDPRGALLLESMSDNDTVWASQVVAGTFDITKNDDHDPINVNFHQSLLACSPTYVQIMSELSAKLNTLPPSAAIAGIYTMVDNSRGVWKAPANVSLSSVSNPTSNITSEQQASYNVDPMTGKSINIIRPFRGIGTMVWGARTLDGNSQDWRYINVRRTLIMIEQSIKLAMRAYVFEPNTASTWITVQSMMADFLTNMWKQGALAGAEPEQAFDVQIGLGTTMTPNDILDGKMLVTIKVAIARPAEFIILTFQQMQQQS